MINIHKKLKNNNYKTKMLLQVHDELVFDVFKPELEKIKSLVKSEMENAYEMSIPLEVEIDTGKNWLEAH
jgi:DNA polymerase-1